MCKGINVKIVEIEKTLIQLLRMNWYSLFWSITHLRTSI